MGMDCIALAASRPLHRRIAAAPLGIAPHAKFAAQLRCEAPQNFHPEARRGVDIAVRGKPFASVRHTESETVAVLAEFHRETAAAVLCRVGQELVHDEADRLDPSRRHAGVVSRHGNRFAQHR